MPVRPKRVKRSSNRSLSTSRSRREPSANSRLSEASGEVFSTAPLPSDMPAVTGASRPAAERDVALPRTATTLARAGWRSSHASGICSVEPGGNW